jgi:PAS domain S-box-containing protein
MESSGALAILVSASTTLAVMFCGVAAYCWIRRGPMDRDNRWRLIAEAAILSLITSYSVFVAASPLPGVLPDARHVLITMATLFSGPLVGSVVLIVFSTVRVWIGGVGMTVDLVSSAIVFIVAHFCLRWHQRRGRTPTPFNLFLIGGLITAVVMISNMLVVGDLEKMWVVLNAGLPLWFINPLGLVLLSSLVLWDERTKALLLAKADDNAQFRAVVDNLPVSLVIYDRDGVITLMNRRYEDLYGPDIMRFVGRPVSELRAHLLPDNLTEDLLPDSHPNQLRSQSVTHTLQDASITGRERSLLLTHFKITDAAGEVRANATTGIDVSDLRRSQREAERLQHQLIQASKMEAIGQLAGGIAHDFNNLLGAIMGYASFLHEDLPADSELQGYVGKILRICDRAKALVEQILAFARADRVERRPIDLRAVIAETRDVIRLPQTTRLLFDLGEEAVWFSANEGQICQLIVNLCVNGSDALGGRPGIVSVTLRRAPATEVEAARCFAIDPTRNSGGLITVGREYVRLIVCDDGPGIGPETLKRIMEPFFTTKGRSEGTGLGLPLVHAIVISYGGAYVIESAPGAGVSFTVFLPYEPLIEAIDGALESATEPATRGRERVLIVDDEEDIRDVYMIGLERLGFEVACCHDPIEALAFFAEDPTVWDVVVSDEIMPGISGTEMLRQMRALRPNLPTILCTGFGELVTNAPVSMDHIDIALSKPIEPKRLAEQIRVLVEV